MRVSPAKDVSVAGPRTGLAPSTRSGLWLHVARAIEALRPCLVVIENVRGLLTSPAAPSRDLEPCPWCMGDQADPGLRALGAVLGSLADLRYDARWLVLPASAIGAPHRRERVFLVARPSHSLQDADEQPRLERGVPAPRSPSSRGPRTEPPGRGRAPSPDAEGQRRPERLPPAGVRTRRPRPARRGSRAQLDAGQTELPSQHQQLGSVPQPGPERQWGPYDAAITR
ncbi:DNA cytosine methyltransferase [Streptomyces sp. NPDC060243]|uniref:DNA cytosine methyltransferase n=1 Tax=Streptomyces sp. NPDC060243 TaxID=3347081 RepID=UPI0036616D4A